MYNKVIVIGGIARSGTSWLGQIIDSSPDVIYHFQPLFSYAFKGRVNENSSEGEFKAFFDDIYESRDSFMQQQDKRDSGDYPIFHKNTPPNTLAFKTCRYQYAIEPMLRKNPKVKVLGIVRNPCAALNSWMSHPSEFPKGSVRSEEWRHGKCKNSGPEDFYGYYKWREVANNYLDLRDKYPERVLVVNYQNLVSDTISLVEEIYAFTGLELTEQTKNFLQKSTSTHNNNYYAVFKDKSVAHRWKGELEPEIAAEIEADIRGTRLEQFLN